MLGTYPYSFDCGDGFCSFLGCTGDDECNAVPGLRGWVCAQDTEVPSCTPGCDADDDCATAGLVGWICLPPGHCGPLPCASHDDCGPGMACNPDSGSCFTGCTDDAQCDGFGHCDVELRTCTCSSADECSKGFACAPG